MGLEATLDALTQGQVDVLVVAADLDVHAWRCEQCRRVIATNANACPTCAGPLKQAPLRQLLPGLAARSGATLQLVRPYENGGLKKHGGLGALLRYAR